MNTLELEAHYCAHNYHPLPVVLVKGEGCYLWDENGKRYLDMMSAYSAVSHGHCHPRLVEAMAEQAQRLTIVSRAFHTDTLAPFLKMICEMTGQPRALPMNTGAEAVETALKAARKWAYAKKGVAADKAEIIVCDGNFHGRTITIVSFSSEVQYRDQFGPLTPGFKRIAYGDVDALAGAITENSAAFLVEPVQGEAGIVMPPPGYLAKCAELCKRHNVLLICDEVQSGLGRTGKLLACQHDGVQPDGLILGKALGGGMMPVSLFLAREDVMAQFEPGDHGSTFGGNPLASAVALEALKVLQDEKLVERSERLGRYMLQRLQAIKSDAICEVRGRGLFIGIELDPQRISARAVCEQLMAKGVLSKETHETVVRMAPPLIITEAQIDETVDALAQVLTTL